MTDTEDPTVDDLFYDSKQEYWEQVWAEYADALRAQATQPIVRVVWRGPEERVLDNGYVLKNLPQKEIQFNSEPTGLEPMGEAELTWRAVRLPNGDIEVAGFNQAALREIARDV